jgi:hypothetical protein
MLHRLFSVSCFYHYRNSGFNSQCAKRTTKGSFEHINFEIVKKSESKSVIKIKASSLTDKLCTNKVTQILFQLSNREATRKRTKKYQLKKAINFDRLVVRKFVV